MHCVDLGESFPTRIYLQKSASIQPRTSPSKFGGKIQFTIHFTPYSRPTRRSPTARGGPPARAPLLPGRRRGSPALVARALRSAPGAQSRAAPGRGYPSVRDSAAQPSRVPSPAPRQASPRQSSRGAERPADRLSVSLRALRGSPTGEYGSSEELLHVRNRPESPGIAAVIRL